MADRIGVTAILLLLISIRINIGLLGGRLDMYNSYFIVID